MRFSYKATTQKGEVSTGFIEAESPLLAAKDLRGQGLVPLSVVLAKDKKKFSLTSVSFDKVKLSEKIVFTKNLAGMLEAGLSLARALQVLEKQTKNKLFKKIIGDLLAEIDRGGTLSLGMEKHPTVFSTLFTAIVRAGEESGSLPASLKEVGGHLEKAYELTRKIKGAMTYPAVIMCAIVLVGVLMMIYVVPTLTATFIELGIDLPGSTRFIIAISDLLKNHILLLVGIVFILVFGIVTLLKKSVVAKKFFDKITLRLPVIGTIVKEVNTARTTRTLASLLASGVSMTKAIDITHDVLQNDEYKTVLLQGRTSIEKGGALSETFKSAQNLYPVMVGEMMEVGEETGKFSEMLMDIAQFYEKEVDNKTKNLSAIIEPVLMIVIGAAVGFFALSMITPMYSIINAF